MRVNSGGIGSGCGTFSAMTSPLQTVSAPCNFVDALIISAVEATTSASARPISSFFASAFSASAAALSGSEASNSVSSLPLSLPSSHAVHFSSNVLINVLQQILQFLACIEQARHHCANRAAERFCDFVILHFFNLLHQNDGTMLGRQLGNCVVDLLPNLAPLHCFIWQCILFRYRFGCRVDFL